MRKKLRAFYIFPLIFAGFFINCYCSVPATVSLTEGSGYTLELNRFCNVSSASIPTAANGEALAEHTSNGIRLNTATSGRYTIGVKLFNFLPLKNIEVNVAPEYCVIPSGEPVGIKIFSDGLLVINVSEVKTKDGVVSPAKSAGIAVGDRIISADSLYPATSEELAEIVNSSSGDVELAILRGEDEINVTLTPALSADDGTRKLGIWVRDSTAGVGTMTFYDPKTKTFATLGHGITDTDTGDIVIPKRGTLTDCNIISVKKGTVGEPGELGGRFGAKTYGDILMNSSFGVYGRLTAGEKLDDSAYMKVATRFEVKQGEAYILADVDGNGTKRYSISIDEVSKAEESGNKGLVISVTDSALLEKTGGIVQGMSGAPIIQNNMLVGAVTHVFVNDPRRGYGIFAENMLEEAGKVA